MTTVLLTGFEPFDGAVSNSSWDAVELVADEWDDPASLVIECLPVTFAGAGSAMRQLIIRHSPDLVIAVGLANGRTAVTPERIAINVEDARIPDNDGATPIDRPLDAAGPAARWSGLDVKTIARAIADAGIASAVSNSAGTYVCNSLMYQLMAAVAERDVRAGFIHVPASPEIAGPGEPRMAVHEIARAIRIAIDVTLSTATATPATA